jgi:RimJ/RimL family protein N-acetyltransferase
VVDLIPPDPPLRSAAVWLRPFKTEDAPLVAEACQDPAIGRFTFMKEGLTVAEAAEWIAKSNQQWADLARFAIVDPRANQVVGQVGMAVNWEYVSAEAFYWLARPGRGRGLAAAALALLAGWAFDVVGIERLYLLIHPGNTSSERVAQRCGFTREGALRSYQPFKGGRPDMISYSLLPTDPRSDWR